jgi:murein DD-endopeptidase MepM/ murein hydrolase activator NlpD
MFGCNRYGGTCNGSGDRNKNHAGIDLKNPYGAPIFAMFNGSVYSTPYDPNGAGYMVQIQSTLPSGETIITTYFHLQKDNRIQATTSPLTHVTAGQIIDYQGDSGNLASAIKGGYTDSHVHVETRLHDGSSSWNFDNNFNLVDTRNYLETEIDDNGDISDDCN